MIVFDTETVTKLDLLCLVRGISEARDITYREAEKLLPGHVFEGCVVGHDHSEDWARELIVYMKYERIDCVEIYQDE